MQMTWRQQISYNFANVNKLKDWDSLRLRNLDRYMKLYTSWIVYEGFVLIAHRKYISVFQLSNTAPEGKFSLP